jgi:hypothetical protein
MTVLKPGRGAAHAADGGGRETSARRQSRRQCGLRNQGRDRSGPIFKAVEPLRTELVASATLSQCATKRMRAVALTLCGRWFREVQERGKLSAAAATLSLSGFAVLHSQKSSH